MAEQRYEAVRAVIADGETVTSAAARFGVSRKTMHVWLARYEAGGLEDLAVQSQPGVMSTRVAPINRSRSGTHQPKALKGT